MVENKPAIRVGVRYNKDDFAACTYALCLWVGNALDTIASTIPQEDKWHEKYATLGDRLVAHIEKDNDHRAAKRAE